MISITLSCSDAELIYRELTIAYQSEPSDDIAATILRIRDNLRDQIDQQSEHEETKP